MNLCRQADSQLADVYHVLPTPQQTQHVWLQHLFVLSFLVWQKFYWTHLCIISLNNKIHGKNLPIYVLFGLSQVFWSSYMF